jgi:lipopolysaccharide/colanic/teichoic acid biosynthesis glycosyltransferase
MSKQKNINPYFILYGENKAPINAVIRRYSIAALLIDFILINAAFFIVYYLKTSGIEISVSYTKLLYTFYFTWFIISAGFKKFNLNKYTEVKKGITSLLRSDITFLYIISLMIVFVQLHGYSRLQIFGTIAIFTLLEIITYLIYFHFTGKKVFESLRSAAIVEKSDKSKFSLKVFIFDLSIFLFSFFTVNYIKRGNFVLPDEYEKIFLVLLGSWFIISLFTRKFDKHDYRNIYYAVAPFVKTFIILFATMAVIIFAFRLFYYSRTQIFGTLLLMSVIEILSYYLYFILFRKPKNNSDIETLEDVQKTLSEEISAETPNGKKFNDFVPAKYNLREKYLKTNFELYDFINKNIDLERIDTRCTEVLFTRTLYNIETINNNFLKLFINLHQVNDFRQINRYFLQVHRTLNDGGFFVSKAETIVTHKKRFYKKMTPFLGKLLYPFNFLYVRVMPKLSFTQKLYFALSGGRNRVLSKAEILGRLSFCGFKIIAEQEIEDSLYFIAQRMSQPLIRQNPYYGMIIKLPRVGLDGNIIHIRKFRTMHPYSDYLQDYIYRTNQLQENGKFSDDFRITEWGYLFRKFWIDELPQIINFWQGDINLIGVRALSQHYFSLYPQDLQQLRIKFKPGLVPPYYADMPKSFEEIVESERKYLLLKQQKPFQTDIKYFFKAFYNIIFKKARSR